MFGPYLDFFDSSFDSLYWLELFSWSGPFNINSGVGVIALHTCAFVPSVVSLPCVPYGTRLIKMAIPPFVCCRLPLCRLCLVASLHVTPQPDDVAVVRSG